MRRIIRALSIFLAVCTGLNRADAQLPPVTPETLLRRIESDIAAGRDAAAGNRCEELKVIIRLLEKNYTNDAVLARFQAEKAPLDQRARIEIVRKARDAAAGLKPLLAKTDCNKPPVATVFFPQEYHLLQEAMFRVVNTFQDSRCVEFYVATAVLAKAIETFSPELERKLDGPAQRAKEFLDHMLKLGCPPKETRQAIQQQGAPLKKGEPRIALPKGAPPVAAPGLIINTGFDGSQWCTYGSGIGFPTFAPPTDDSGTPLFPGGTFINDPPTWPLPPITTTPGGDITITTGPPTGPTIIDTPSGPPLILFPPPPPGSVPPPETPVAAPPSSPPTGKPPETPVAGPPTDKPPEQTPPTIVFPPVGAPPETPIIIFVKATQSVLEGQPQGTGLPGYNTALFAPKPDLPFIDDGTQTAQDTGFDQDPVKCTTGQGGECKLNLSLGALKDIGAAMGFDTGSNPPSHFRIDYSVPQTTGGVLEITGLGGNDVINIDTLRSGLPDQVNIYPDIFNIGDRSFLRLGSDQPFGLNFDFGSHVTTQLSDAKLFGRPVIYIIDFCRDKQPGPPLGAQPASYSSMNQALPAVTVRLRHSILDRLRALTAATGGS